MYNLPKTSKGQDHAIPPSLQTKLSSSLKPDDIPRYDFMELELIGRLLQAQWLKCVDWSEDSVQEGQMMMIMSI